MKKRLARYVPIARENIKSDNPFGGTYISCGMVDNERTNLYIMETIKDMFNKMQDEDLSGDSTIRHSENSESRHRRQTIPARKSNGVLECS